VGQGDPQPSEHFVRVLTTTGEGKKFWRRGVVYCKSNNRTVSNKTHGTHYVQLGYHMDATARVVARVIRVRECE
jgi:hypothetical protein